MEPLIEALNDDNSDVRCYAAIGLGGIGDARAWEPLITCFGYDVPVKFDSIVNAIRSHYEKICEAFTPVVKQQGSANAAVYNPEIPGPHPLVVLETDGSASLWNDSLPTGWAPLSVSDVELVVVTENREEELDSQKYTGGSSLTRVRQNKYVIVREARTGAILKSVTLQGPNPGSFPFFKDASRTKLYGSEVSFIDFLQWWTGED